jgi:hypothetical protein
MHSIVEALAHNPHSRPPSPRPPARRPARHNQLNPAVNKTPFTEWEQAVIVKARPPRGAGAGGRALLCAERQAVALRHGSVRAASRGAAVRVAV